MSKILILFGLIWGLTLNASISISSITKTDSRCINNGSITVNAVSTSQIFYSIISGPTSVSPQSTNKFEGLPPGTYQVQVENLSNEKATASITISSTYIIIDFTPLINHVSCNGANDGRVIGNPNTNTGVVPFTWKLKNNNTGQTKTQVGNDTFSNLSPGDYTMTVTDSCLNTTVHNFAINSGISGFTFLNSQYKKVDCDKVEILSNFQAKEASFPSKIKYEYNNTILIQTPTANGNNSIKDIVNITIPLGQKIKVTLYNLCNDSISTIASSYNDISICKEFTTCNSVKFSLKSTTFTTLPITKINYTSKNGTFTASNLAFGTNEISFIAQNIDEGDNIRFDIINKCNDTISTSYVISIFKYLIQRSFNTYNTKCNQRNYVYSFDKCDLTKGDISYTFYNSKNELLESKTIQGIQDIILSGYPSGNNYYIKIKNGCNKEYIDSFFWEQNQATPFFKIYKQFESTCLDSTVAIEVSFDRLKGEPILVSFTGPSTIHSSKPFYAFSDSTNFEKLLPLQRFVYYGLGVGKYSITIKDSCDYYTENFEILPSDVSNNFYSYKPVKACQDNNQLILQLYSNHVTDLNDKKISGFYSIYNLKTSLYLDNDQAIAFKYGQYPNNFSHFDTFKYLNEGKYLLKLRYRKDTFSEDIGFENYITNKVFCNEIIDTLIIPPYTRPNIKVIVKIQCGTQTWVELIPDTAFGIFPYKFEINKGPELFPVQYSNIFPINIMGNYQAKIWDTCGNSNTMDFSVDTVKFNKIYINDSTCAGDSVIMAYQYSPYFTYKWLKPDGSVFIGDTVKINPIQYKDIGKYHVTKYVNFRGCKDSFFIDYSLNKYKYYHKYDTIKDGDTFYFKNQPIIKEGIYTETIPMLPCDSFFVQHLYVIDTYLIFNTIKEICKGDSVFYRGKYYTKEGEYRDTVDVFKYADSVFVLMLKLYPKSNWKVVEKSDVSCFNANNGVISIKAYGQYKPFTYILNHTYINNDGQFNNLPPGNYFVEIRNSLGCTVDTVFNIAQPDKLILEIYPETNPIEVCSYSKLISKIRYINGGPLPHLKYLWTPSTGLSCADCPSPNFNSYTTQNYTLEVKDDNNCIIKAQTKINVNATNELFIPKIFTPNEDLVNDKFKVYGNCIRKIDFSIYNRWGEKVFHANGLNEGWDGSYKSIPCPNGVYTYIAITTFLNGEIRNSSGEFLLTK